MGSLDGKSVEVIDVANETVLAVLVYPDGRVRIRTDQSPEWVLGMLGMLVESYCKEIEANGDGSQQNH